MRVTWALGGPSLNVIRQLLAGLDHSKCLLECPLAMADLQTS